MKRPRFGMIARMALLVVAIEVAAFSALGWAYVDRFGSAAEQGLRDRLLRVGRLISHNELAVGNLSNRDLIAGLVNAPYLNGVVVGGSGRVIVALDPSQLGRRFDTVPGLDPQWFDDGHADDHVVAGDGVVTVIAHTRATANGPPIYSTVITVSTSALTELKHSASLWGWLISGGFVLLSSAGIILVAQRLISRRMMSSLEVLKRVEAGDLAARIPVSMDDELGQLQHGINAMTNTLSGLVQRHRHSEKQIAAILDATTDGVIAVGADGRVLRCNPSAAAILGCTQEECTAAHIGQLLPQVAPDQPRWWCTADSLTTFSRIHFERPDTEGVPRAIELGHGPIRNADGDIVGAVLVLQDVTIRRRTDHELREAVERLTVSNSELERFAYVASHDLQEPLRTITSFTQLLDRRLGDKLEGEDRESFDFVVGAAKRMSLLISDLLAFSRVNSRGIPFTHIPLGRACRSALDNLRDSITSAGAKIEVGKLPEVRGDESQLTQLFQNLIGNAVKFRAPARPPHVTISATHQGAFWRVTVSDNGIGVAPTNQDIFEIFRRLHGAGAYPGSGVGLAICKRIVQRHGGHIWFDRRADGQGSDFHFTLPVETEEQNEQTPANETAAAAGVSAP